MLNYDPAERLRWRVTFQVRRRRFLTAALSRHSLASMSRAPLLRHVKKATVKPDGRLEIVASRHQLELLADGLLARSQNVFDQPTGWTQQAVRTLRGAANASVVELLALVGTQPRLDL